ARLLRIVGLAGKATESEVMVAKLTRLMKLMNESSKVIKEEETLRKILSHLPEEDALKMMKALEKAELEGVNDFSKLAAKHPELGSALKKAELLHDFALKSGRFSEDVIQAFERLSTHAKLSPDDLEFLIQAIPEGDGLRFAKAVEYIPSSAFAS